MNNKLILYNGPTSPFGRKVKIVSIVQEIDLEEKIINVYEADFLDKSNPLRKIPTLLINNLSIIDSDNICLYLDSSQFIVLRVLVSSLLIIFLLCS